MHEGLSTKDFVEQVYLPGGGWEEAKRGGCIDFF